MLLATSPPTGRTEGQVVNNCTPELQDSDGGPLLGISRGDFPRRVADLAG